MTLGQRIKLARKSAALTQLALAQILNPGATAGSRISNYEQDLEKKQPSTAALKTIARATGVNLLWLIDGVGLMRGGPSSKPVPQGEGHAPAPAPGADAAMIARTSQLIEDVYILREILDRMLKQTVFNRPREALEMRRSLLGDIERRYLGAGYLPHAIDILGRAHHAEAPDPSAGKRLLSGAARKSPKRPSRKPQGDGKGKAS